MDKKMLSDLSRISNLIHEQNTARLKVAQSQLDGMRSELSALLKRPGQLVVDTLPEPSMFLAQTKWSNSAEAQRPGLEADMRRLEAEIEKRLLETRRSFGRVKGVEQLQEDASKRAREVVAKREETTQEMIVLSKAIRAKE